MRWSWWSRFLFLFVYFALLLSIGCAEPGGFLIDNFDTGTIEDTPKWWTFGNVQCSCTEATAAQRGLYVLRVNGAADNFYVGGMGTYIGKDVQGVDTIVMDVLGNGSQSGKIKIELYQNDRGNWQVEQDATGAPLYNARFEFEITVDWHGWRNIEIPLQLFKHSNPGIGADHLKLGFADGSGGLLSYQLIFIAPTAKGTVDLGIDNIRLVMRNLGS